MSVSLWYRSRSLPQQYRYDITLYKSLWVYLRDGTCGMQVLSMPTKVASASEDYRTLPYDPIPDGQSLMLSSSRHGPYRTTWIVFPLWLPTVLLGLAVCTPVVSGPGRRYVRRWRGLCAECGYNLTGSPSGRCPECGTMSDGARRRRATRRNRRRLIT